MVSNRGYPTPGYRGFPRRKRGGFQDRGPVAGFTVPGKLPTVPATGPFWGPGGGNLPTWGPWSPGPANLPGEGFPGSPIGGAGAAWALARFGLRLIPWIGLIVIGYELWQLWRTNPGAWGFQAMGYVKQMDCGRGNTRTSTSGILFCSGASAANPSVWNGISFPNYLFTWRQRPSDMRFLINQWWNREGVPFPIRPRVLPAPTWNPFEDPEPEPMPWLNPEVPLDPKPGVQPWPWPQPLPPAYAPLQPTWHPQSPEPVRVEPGTPPGPAAPHWPWPEEGWPGWWPTPVPAPQPGPQPAPQPGPPVLPGTQTPVPAPLTPPATPPTTGVPQPIPPAISVTSRTRPSKVRPRNRPAKPSSRTRERKFVMSPNAKSWLGIALNLLTESGDVIDAFWWALPREVRTRPSWDPLTESWHAPGLAQKARDVYNHAPLVDGQKALENFIANQVGDFVGGQFGKATAKANRNMWDQFGGSGFGLGRGPAL